jgi:hypothetical protein
MPTPNNPWEGSVNGGWFHATGAQEIVRPWPLIRRFWQARQLHR